MRFHLSTPNLSFFLLLKKVCREISHNPSVDLSIESACECPHSSNPIPFVWRVSEENRDRARSTFYPCRLMPVTKNCLRAKRSVLLLRKRPFYGDGGLDSPPGCATGAFTKLGIAPFRLRPSLEEGADQPPISGTNLATGSDVGAFRHRYSGFETIDSARFPADSATNSRPVPPSTTAPACSPPC